MFNKSCQNCQLSNIYISINLYIQVDTFPNNKLSHHRQDPWKGYFFSWGEIQFLLPQKFAKISLPFTIKNMIEYQAQCPIHHIEASYVCLAQDCNQRRLLCSMCKKKDYVHFHHHAKHIYPWQEFIHFLSQDTAVENLYKTLAAITMNVSTHKVHFVQQINNMRQDFLNFQRQVSKAIESEEKEMLKLMFSQANKFDPEIKLIQSKLRYLANQQNPEIEQNSVNNLINEKNINEIIDKNAKLFQLREDLVVLRQNFSQSKNNQLFYSQIDDEGFLTRQGKRFIENSLVPFLNHFEDDLSSFPEEKRSFSTQQKSPTLSTLEFEMINTKFEIPQLSPQIKKVLKHLPQMEETEDMQKRELHQLYIPSEGIFNGEVKEGLRDGWGHFIFNDGSLYEGQWKNDAMNGFGRIVFKQSYYEGNIVNGKAEGQGKYENNDLIYDGSWKNDKKEGFGREEYKKKKWVYVGYFSANEYEGKGELINKDYIYQGNFKNGQYHGEGIVFYKSKEVFQGTFDNGHMLKGKLSYPNGSYYEGMFQNNVPHGIGEFTWDDGMKYEGCWKNGKQDGEGTHILENKHEYQGVWKDGEWMNWI